PLTARSHGLRRGLLAFALTGWRSFLAYWLRSDRCEFLRNPESHHFYVAHPREDVKLPRCRLRAPGLIIASTVCLKGFAKVAVKVCPSCSAANPDSLHFCGQCGRALRAANEAQTVVMDGPTATQPAPAGQPLTAAGLITPPPSASQSATWGMAPPPGSDATWGLPVPGAVLPTNLPGGTAFGARYRIESLLGEGGMGAVYKAYDTELGRTVALKLVRPELATNPQTMRRFKQELLLASKISQKNILRIHDLG